MIPNDEDRKAVASRPERDSAACRVLIVDDDRELCALLAEYLRPLGFEVAAEYRGGSGLERARRESWHAVILDIMLPDMDGLEVLRRLRRESDVPVLMLTARGEEADRIVGLELGADDYLPKTFSTRELLARLRAVIRRAHAETRVDATPPPPAELRVGALRVQPGTRRAWREDRPLELTPIEFDILVCLAKAPGRVRSRDQILSAVAGREWEAFDRSVDVHICNLRRKLGDDPRNPRYIRTLRSAGYLLVDPERDLEA